MGNCLVTTLKGSVNNPYLRKIDDYVVELIGQPGSYPQRSGRFLAKPGTTLQVRCLTPGVQFANGKGTVFEIGDDATVDQTERSIGLTGDGVVAIGPKSNISDLGAFTDHVKEVPLSLNGVGVSSIACMFMDDPRVMDINFFKNLSLISTGTINAVVGIPQLYGLKFNGGGNAFHLEVTELLEMYYHNHNYGTFAVTINVENTEWPKFMGTPMKDNIGSTPFIISAEGVKGYQSGHNGDDNYITCQYDGSTWTLVGQNS